MEIKPPIDKEFARLRIKDIKNIILEKENDIMRLSSQVGNLKSERNFLEDLVNDITEDDRKMLDRIDEGYRRYID